MNFKTVNVEIRKDEFIKNSDVEIHLKDRIYSYLLHDYIATITLTDEVLEYLANKKLCTIEQLEAMYKEGFVLALKLPASLLFTESEKVIKCTEREYEQDTL